MCRGQRTSDSRSQDSRTPLHKYCHHFEVIVVAPSCLLLEVNCEIASKRTIRLSTVLDYATHRQTMRPPPFLQLAPSSPYLAFKTWYHNPSLSISILQHHFPTKDKLNSCNFLAFNPPSSFGVQIECQSTHEIFLISSLPQKKKKKIQEKILYLRGPWRRKKSKSEEMTGHI